MNELDSKPQMQKSGKQSMDERRTQTTQQIEFSQANRNSFMERHRINGKKIGKILILISLLILLVWLSTTILGSVIFSAKSYTKIPAKPEMQQFSGIDEQVWRSYYYFTQMWDMAKSNIKDNKEFDLSLVMNRFGDITFPELFGLFKVVKSIQYAKNYTTSLDKQKSKKQFDKEFDPEDLTKYYNFTDYFNPATNQYQCASCYSFPITATIEYIYKKYKGISIKLSEQQLIDCSNEDGVIDGCKSGNITKGFEYAQKVGLVSQDDYPYRSKGGHSFTCRKQILNNPSVKKYKIDGFRMLPRQNCQAIQYQLSKGNAVATMVAIQPSELSYFRAKDGKPYRNCPKEPFNHAVTIVGQTEKASSNSKQNWIIRNSWGISWGVNGYFMIKGGNTCGICTHAIVPYFDSEK